MANIGQLTAVVGVDTKDVKKGLKVADKELNKFKKKSAEWPKQTDANAAKASKSWKKLGVAVGGVAAAYAAFAGVKAVTQAFVRQEDAIAQLEARLKSTKGVVGLTSQQLQMMAAELQGVTKFGDEAVIEMQSMLLTFTKIGGETFPQATEAILNVSTAMGQDLKSASIQVGKALNDPILGVTALQRSGIQFTDSQKEMIKTLVKSGDTIGAQTIILNELETQFGGAARAAKDTLGGALQSAENASGDFAESLGKVLAPKIRELASVVEFTAVALREMIDPTIEGDIRALDKEIDGLSDTYRELDESATFHGGSLEAAKAVEAQINELVEERIALQEKLNELREPKAFKTQVPQAGGAGGVVPGVDGSFIDSGGAGSSFAPGGILGTGGSDSLSGLGGEQTFVGSFFGDPESIAAEGGEVLAEVQAVSDSLVGSHLAMEAEIVASEERIAQATAQAGKDKQQVWAQTGTALVNISGQMAAGMGKNAKGLQKVLQVTGGGIALINTAIGASEALKLGFPQGIPAALAVFSQGLSFVSAIGGAGGNTGGAPSSASAGVASLDPTGGVEAPTGTAGGPQAQITIQVDGDVVDLDEWMEKKGGPAIRAAVGRGVDFGLEIERGNV